MALVDHTAHRPWPLPRGPWVMRQVWHDLLFAHWPMPAGTLRAALPRGIELDVFDGEAWLGIVPFRMSGVRLRYTPPLPWLSAFPELNLRTYVRVEGKPGVYFFCLEAGNPLAVEIARRWYRLPYHRAEMSCVPSGPGGNDIRYAHVRTDNRGAPAELAVRYGPRGDVFASKPGSLEHWLTERYCLYTVNARGNALGNPLGNARGNPRGDARGGVMRGDIHHLPWPLQPAVAEFDRNTLARAHGFELPDRAPLLHFARRIEMVAWPIVRVDR
jgi:uncharacterized protein YqjF (DUF2071 family)